MVNLVIGIVLGFTIAFATLYGAEWLNHHRATRGRHGEAEAD